VASRLSCHAVAELTQGLGKLIPRESSGDPHMAIRSSRT
jgi:hypothetical protein